MTRQEIERLKALLSCPTAPFREQHVARHVTQSLEAMKIPFFTDPIGNIVIGAASQRDYRRRLGERRRQAPALFVAHMDHPGFHGTGWTASGRLRVRWFGGAPVKRVAGARVRLVDDEGLVGHGVLRNVRLTRSRRSIAGAEVAVERGLFDSRRRPAARSLFGGFAFRAPVWRSGQRIYCPAADDLVGVYAVLETARRRWHRGGGRGGPAFLGLLTRAEEVGFVGAVGHLDLGWLQRTQRPPLIVSLEASRTLPGAEIGKGPIVRLGDHSSVFDPDGTRILSNTAAGALPGAHQRRIMDGGSCEATAVTAWGLAATGISIPLGNYHNQGFEGGADSRGPDGPSPEFVSLKDVDGLLRLCAALTEPDTRRAAPWRGHRDRLEKNFRRLRRHL